jgi:hypothetical protein
MAVRIHLRRLSHVGNLLLGDVMTGSIEERLSALEQALDRIERSEHPAQVSDKWRKRARAAEALVEALEAALDECERHPHRAANIARSALSETRTSDQDSE